MGDHITLHLGDKKISIGYVIHEEVVHPINTDPPMENVNTTYISYQEELVIHFSYLHAINEVLVPHGKSMTDNRSVCGILVGLYDDQFYLTVIKPF